MLTRVGFSLPVVEASFRSAAESYAVMRPLFILFDRIPYLTNDFLQKTLPVLAAALFVALIILVVLSDSGFVGLRFNEWC